MIIKEREWNKCKCCNLNTSLKTEEAYGCDACGIVIDLQKKGTDYLSATIFKGKVDSKSEERQYCSWKCCLNDLKKVRTDYFITLPYLSFDTANKKLHPREFFKLMKP